MGGGEWVAGASMNEGNVPRFLVVYTEWPWSMIGGLGRDDESPVIV